MAPLEPQGRKEKRIELAIKLLRNSQPDIIFLQEMSPAPDMSQRFAQELEMSEIHHIDNGGIRIRHLGIPSVLYGGLTTLARPKYNLKNLGAAQLSGSKINFTSDWFCFQFKEARIAVFGLVENTPWGNLLVCNTHLHHGIELTNQLKTKINTLLQTQEITASEASAVFDFCYTARDRRLRELDKLKKNIDQLQSKHSIDNIILAGDLNCSDESLEWKKIISWGFKDCFTPGESTWSSDLNKENHKIGHNFFFPWPLDRITRDPHHKEILRQAFLKNEFRQRRIDYVFCRGPISSALEKSYLFANEADASGLIASDHFGVISEFAV